MNDKINYLECACFDAAHTIRFISDADTNELYIETQLSQYYGFFKRIWLAIKYVFGYSNKTGHWDGTLLCPARVDDLLRLTLTHKLTCESEVSATSDEFLRTLLYHKLKCENEQSSAVKIKKAIKTLTSNSIYTDVNVYVGKKRA